MAASCHRRRAGSNCSFRDRAREMRKHYCEGKVLFAQNTYVDDRLSPVKAKPGEEAEALFIRMPILPRGSYTVDVAIAEGSPPEVVQLQWLHDAFSLESHTSTSLLYSVHQLILHWVELRNANR
jgi:lipopolysaccharide transport system ATP-binding protein